MAKIKKITILPNIPIHGIADRGKGVGRTENGLAVFAEGAVPGDVVDVFVQKKKSGFAEGRVERIVKPSVDRIVPFCQHFEICGGCKWQNLDYSAQLEHKQKVVEDALLRIGKVEVEEFLPILGAPEIQFYRNKLEFGFSNRRWLYEHEIDESGEKPNHPGLGFHRAGFFDKVIDIQKCWLQPDPSNLLRNTAREIALEQNIAFYDLRHHTGMLRNLMARITTTGETMALFSFARRDDEVIRQYLDTVIERMNGQITTVVYCINTKLNDSMFDLEMITYTGKGYVEEQLGDLRFKIGPKSFFQTNSRQGKNLYDIVVNFAGLTGIENVYDLYTGAGSIALYLARFCKQVVGIEEIPEAIEDAFENMSLNNIENTIFYAGDVKNVLNPDFAVRHGRPDIVITDPPRVGMHEKAVEFLRQLAAPRLVYVSCNPSTQARDLSLLRDMYTVKKVQAVDMFPHTHHIENVALLELNEVL